MGMFGSSIGKKLTERDICQNWINDQFTVIRQLENFYTKKLDDWMIDRSTYQIIMRSLSQMKTIVQKGNLIPDSYDDLKMDYSGLQERKLIWKVYTESYADLINPLLLWDTDNFTGEDQ